jgi:hypothetical protein
MVVNRPCANARGSRDGAPISEELDAIVEFGGDLGRNPKLGEEFLEEGEMSDLDEAADGRRYCRPRSSRRQGVDVLVEIVGGVSRRDLAFSQQALEREA